MNLKPKHIVFDARSGLGGTVEYIPAIMMLKAMYPRSELLVITNSIGAQIYANFNYINRVEVCNTGPKTDAKYLSLINSFKDEDGNQKVADVIFLCDRDNEKIRLALRSDCRHIITFANMKKMAMSRIHYTSHAGSSRMHEMFQYQTIVREANQKIYDDAFEKIDLSYARLKPTKEQHMHAVNFLKSVGYDPEEYKLVTINPISVDAEKRDYNFKHEDYIRLGEELARTYKRCFFVLLSYGEQSFHNHKFDLPNFKLYINDDDLMHMVALVGRSRLLISPSTGNTHIADNLGVDVVGPWPYFEYPRRGADGFKQLAEKQGKGYDKINEFEFINLDENWRDDYESVFNRFTRMCHNHIKNYVLKPKGKPSFFKQAAALQAEASVAAAKQIAEAKAAALEERRARRAAAGGAAASGTRAHATRTATRTRSARA